MVLDYWGEALSQEQLMTDLAEYYKKDIVHSEGIGIYSAQKGYNVDFHVHDINVTTPALYRASDQKALQEAIDEALDKNQDDERFEYQHSKLRLLKRCIEAGVRLHTDVPDLSVIESAIDRDIPVICSIKANLLVPENRRPLASGANHSVVVVGYDDESVWINDPGAEKDGLTDPYAVPRNDFIMGWYMVSARTWSIAAE
jgi:hypothetical protein